MNNGIISQGLYLYGFIPNHYEAEQFQKLGSINVYTIPFKKVSAVVSRSTIIDFRQLSTEPLAKLLIEHQRTIESIMSMGFGTIIPMRIGTFANNTSEVISILEKGYELIVEVLSKVTSLLEIDIVALWSDFGSIIAEIAVNPRILEMKANIIENKISITQHDQLAIGTLVKKILDEKKAELAEIMTESLSPFCHDRKQHELMNDEMIFNNAFLVNQHQAELLEKTLDQLDEKLGGKVNFKMVGPLPCYSFYTMEIRELCYSEVDSAKRALGLQNSTSEKAIKQAYIEKVKQHHPDKNLGDENIQIFNEVSKAYQTMLDYVNAVKPASREDHFSLLKETVTENSFFLKIKE